MAAASRTLFYGFGAYVGAITGPTQCEWWADDPTALKWAKGPRVAVDLAANVSAVRSGAIGIADLQVDDHRTDGGQTTIGPRFPGGVMIGACWLAEPYYESLGNKPPRQPTSGPIEAYDYELTSIYDWAGQGSRYYGFHANTVGSSGSLTRVEIWQPGTGRAGGSPAGTWWLDLQAQALGGAGATTITASQGAGALFLDEATVGGLKLYGPKIPRSIGLDYLVPERG